MFTIFIKCLLSNIKIVTITTIQGVYEGENECILESSLVLSFSINIQSVWSGFFNAK